MKRLAVNFAAFQIGWFGCVLGASNGLPLLGPVIVLLVMVLHLACAYEPRKELSLILVAAMTGAVFDSLLVQTGWIRYPNGVLLEGTAPYWIVAMWLLFATTLNVSLRWMHRNYTIAAVFGFIGGPLSYLAGARLGGLVFIETAPVIAALAIGWAAIMPFLIWVSIRFDGMQPDDPVVQHA